MKRVDRKSKTVRERRVLTTMRLRRSLRDALEAAAQRGLRRAFGHLSQAQLTAALMYYRRDPEEIQREVDANAAWTAETVEKAFPGLVSVFPGE